MSRRLAALFALGLLLAVLVLVASWAASEEAQVRGVFAIAASGGRVLVGVGNEVVVADERGELLATLRDDGGAPWRFGEVANVAFARDGGALVCDSELHQLVRFASDGSAGQVVHLEQMPRMTFEVVDLGPGYLVADNTGNEVRVTDESGKTVRRRSVRYPNAATMLSESPPRFALVSTGAGKAFAYDLAKLEPVPWQSFEVLNSKHARELKHRELFEMVPLPDGSAFAADCRDLQGECTLVRVDRARATLERVGDTLPFETATPAVTEGLLGVGEIAALSDGSLLVASPRLGVVLKFAGAEGPPPAGFCEQCSPEELRGKERMVWGLEREPLEWPNGARVSLFGGPELLKRFGAIRDARAGLYRIQQGAQLGTYGVAAALLIALFLARQAGAVEDRVGSRLRKVWSRVVLPNRAIYAVAWGLLGAAVAVGAAVGWAAAGPGAMLAFGAVSGFLCSRLVVAPWLAKRLSPDVAKTAFELHLGAGAPTPVPFEVDESVEWVRLGWPQRSLKAIAAGAQEAGGADDWLELIDSLAPRMALLARTNKRLLAVKCSMHGAPQDALLTMDFEPGQLPVDSAAVGLLVVKSARFARVWRLAGGGEKIEVFAERVAWLCEACRQKTGSCPHRGTRMAPVLGLTMLVPGLGHLVAGDFGKARTLLLVGVGLLLQAFETWLPQYVGTVPWNPALWQAPLWAYALTGAVACAMVLMGWWRERVRGEISSG